jgi:hypothetical protein
VVSCPGKNTGQYIGSSYILLTSLLIIKDPFWSMKQKIQPHSLHFLHFCGNCSSSYMNTVSMVSMFSMLVYFHILHVSGYNGKVTILFQCLKSHWVFMSHTDVMCTTLFFRLLDLKALFIPKQGQHSWILWPGSCKWWQNVIR